MCSKDNGIRKWQGDSAKTWQECTKCGKKYKSKHANHFILNRNKYKNSIWKWCLENNYSKFRILLEKILIKE